MLIDTVNKPLDVHDYVLIDFKGPYQSSTSWRCHPAVPISVDKQKYEADEALPKRTAHISSTVAGFVLCRNRSTQTTLTGLKLSDMMLALLTGPRKKTHEDH